MNWFAHAWHWIGSQRGWYWITHTGVTLLAVFATWALTTFNTHRGRRAALNDELRPAIVEVLRSGYALRASLDSAFREARDSPGAAQAFARGTPDARELDALAHESANAVIAARLLCRDPALRGSLERYWVRLANRRMGQDAMAQLVLLKAVDTSYATLPQPVPPDQEAIWKTVAGLRAGGWTPEDFIRNAHQYIETLTEILLCIEADAHRYFTAGPARRHYSAITTRLRDYWRTRRNKRNQAERRREIERNAAASPQEQLITRQSETQISSINAQP